jgi:hypothetical protein
MRQYIAPAVLALSVAFAGSAFAADQKPAKPAMATAKPAAKDPKTEACEKAWKAEKKHTTKHDAFIKACVAKG